MITLEGESLTFRFPEVHEHAKTEINFQRTLRIPDDGKHYPLPPGLGAFPLRHLDDYKTRLPEAWRERGGVMMPLYQAEAMWLAFRRGFGVDGYPFAIKVATGRINAVSGKPWEPGLIDEERDYVVVPEQPWLDGFCVAKDVVRQFVAMPLGSGYSVEEQITGKAQHGGLQLVAYPMKSGRFEELLAERSSERARACGMPSDDVDGLVRRFAPSSRSLGRSARAMGLAPGGRMAQQIFADPYGIDAWDQSVSSRCFVTLLDALQWREITGEPPNTRAPTAAEYTKAGLPWFDYYAADVETLSGSSALAQVKSVSELASEKGEQVLGADGDVDPTNVVTIGTKRLPKGAGRPVRESKT